MKKDIEYEKLFVYTDIKNSIIGKNVSYFKYVKTGIKDSKMLLSFLKKDFLQKFNPTNSRTNCIELSTRLLWFFITGKMIHASNNLSNTDLKNFTFNDFQKMFFESFQASYGIAQTREKIANIFSIRNKMLNSNILDYTDNSYKINVPYGALFHMTTSPSIIFKNGNFEFQRSSCFSNPMHSFCGIFLEDGFFVIDGQTAQVYNIKTQEFLYYSSYFSMMNVKCRYNNNQMYTVYGVYDKDVEPTNNTCRLRNNYYHKIGIL